MIRKSSGNIYFCIIFSLLLISLLGKHHWPYKFSQAIIEKVTGESGNIKTNPQYLDQQLFIGQYSSLQSEKLFDYLDTNSGDVQLLFFTNPFSEKRDYLVNTLDIFLFNPVYRDGKGVGISIELQQHNSTTWIQNDVNISYATFSKKRQQEEFENITVNYTIVIQNSQTEDPGKTSINLTMHGPSFKFQAQFHYYNQVLSTMGYSLYVTFIVAAQIVACYFMLRDTDINANFYSKLSLTTVAICNIEDFYLTMVHIQYIMEANNSYMFFVMPAVAYVFLFVVFDMKLLFLVWRGHYMREIDNPQDLRKKLTTFYIKFYVGLFAYLSLNYFFTYDEWMIILTNLFIIPQIIHNARIGNNPGFSYLYIFGYLGLRFFLPLYQRTCPNNHFLLTPMPILMIVIGLIQLFIIAWLYFQFTLGPRFFIPKFLRPNYFKYSCKLRMTEQNSDLECTICLLSIFENIESLQSMPTSMIQSQIQQPNKSSLLNQVHVMKTPCNHFFHKQCLTKWIDVKLQCPTCRKVLPPV